ncbi:MAG TPA: type II toxin-antitoxin system RelE/ParE family toxin [Humisphaera sp.]
MPSRRGGSGGRSGRRGGRELPPREAGRYGSLDEIWSHVARDNIPAADKLENDLHAAMRMLERMPGAGHRRADVRDERYRFWSVGPYVIAYRTERRSIVVVRVVHGARDFRKLFG